jgi:hypothetical protein
MTLLPDYTIDNVNFSFNSYALQKYCNQKGIEMEDLYNMVREGTAFKSSELPALLLVAAESYALYNKQPFTFTELDAFGWIDSVGGFNSSKVVDVFKIFAARLLNVDLSLLNIEEQEEKNGDRQGVQNHLHGVSSSPLPVNQG